MYGCVFDVRLSARSVRPWKAPSKPITAGRFVYERGELDRVLDRLGARVEEAGAHLARDRSQLEQPLGQARRSSRTGTIVKSVCVKRSACSWAASTTRGCEWPTFMQPTPPAKSMNVLPSTSVIVAPSPSAITSGR